MPDNTNVTSLKVDMRLKTLHDRIWGVLAEVNETNPLSNAACIGILQMVVTELTLTGLGLIGEDSE